MTVDPAQLARYLSRDGTPDDVAAVRAWAAADPHHAAELATLGRLWEIAAELAPSEPAEHVWRGIHERIAALPAPARAPAARGRRSARAAWAAAGIATAASAALLLRHPATSVDTPHDAVPAQTYTTAARQRAMVTLDDGTRVTLAPRSALRVASFGANVREVALDGEAFFDVSRAGGAPFVVRAGAATVRVLGTAFAVRHYGSDAVASVAVTSGKVAVSSRGRPGAYVTLTAGRAALVTDSGTATSADVAEYTEWVDGRLVFHRAPATEVLAALSRWYGYEFRLADPSLARQTLTVVVSTESSAAALATLKLFLDVDLAFDGNLVTLTPRRERRAGSAGRRAAPDTLMTRSSEVGR